MTRGQYEFADGLFYGGRSPTWCHRTFRAVLRESAPAVRDMAWIDLHTGLGPSGVGERIFTGGGTAAAEDLARQWWSDVTRAEDGTAASADAHRHAGRHRAQRGGAAAATRWPHAADAVRDAFFIDSPGWKHAVFDQAMSAIGAAAQGMSQRKG